MARTAVVSKEVYEQVEEIMANESMSRQEAFRRLASTSDKSLGNISASYYREARNRKRGADAPQAPGARSAPSKPRGQRAHNLDQLAQQLADTSKEIMKALDKERKELAEERRKVEEAKKAIMRA